MAVWRPGNGTWYLLQSTAGYRQQQFGLLGDVPVSSALPIRNGETLSRGRAAAVDVPVPLVLDPTPAVAPPLSPVLNKPRRAVVNDALLLSALDQLQAGPAPSV